MTGKGRITSVCAFLGIGVLLSQGIWAQEEIVHSERILYTATPLAPVLFSHHSNDAVYLTRLLQYRNFEIEEVQWYQDPQLTEPVDFPCFVAGLYQTPDYVLFNCQNYDAMRLALLNRTTGQLQLFAGNLVALPEEKTIRNHRPVTQHQQDLLWIRHSDRALVIWSPQENHSWKVRVLSQKGERVQTFFVDYFSNIAYTQERFLQRQTTVLPFDRAYWKTPPTILTTAPNLFLGADQFFYFTTPSNSYPFTRLHRFMYALDRQLDVQPLFLLPPISPSYAFNSLSSQPELITSFVETSGLVMVVDLLQQSYVAHQLFATQEEVLQAFLLGDTMVVWTRPSPSVQENTMHPPSTESKIYALQLTTLEAHTFTLEEDFVRLYALQDSLLALKILQENTELALVELSFWQEDSDLSLRTQHWSTFSPSNLSSFLHLFRVLPL